MKKLLPIRKIAVGTVASGIYYAMHKAGFAFNDQDANQVAQGLVGFAAAYLIPDPRVQRFERKSLSLLARLRVLNTIINAAADPVVAPVSAETPAPKA